MSVVHCHSAASRPRKPMVSVCIANYNGVGVLEDCIASVLSQDAEVTIEIIIHDDASADGSAEWIRCRYPDVELLASEQNIGFCGANNRMVAHARGEYVLLLNNDAELFRDAIKVLLASARAMPTPGILSLPQFDWESGALVDRGCLLDPFYNPVPNLDPNRSDVAMVVGACLFLPRATWQALGGFPETFGSLAEDVFLCCTARLQGLPVRVEQRSGYRHRQGASFGGNRVDHGKLRSTYRRRALSERNKTAVLCICTPGLAMVPLLLLHGILLLAEGAVLALLKRDLRLWREIYTNAAIQTFRQRAFLRAERWRVQRGRVITLLEYVRPFVLLPRKLVMLIRHGVPGLR
ncbi:glycosyltransferase [Luteimonas sp. SMYT11W]|uniref:Glycosyltransferase n=1 Tax=Luteimonas flava TaxID=3115822 RepID=A0ABU7WKW7_9GAMM